MLKNLKVLFFACECAFQRPKHNANEGSSELNFNAKEGSHELNFDRLKIQK